MQDALEVTVASLEADAQAAEADSAKLQHDKVGSVPFLRQGRTQARACG